MHKCWFIPLFQFILYSCDSKKQDAPLPTQTETNFENKPDSFFPVTSYIKGQIFVLDSTQISPIQIITVNQKSDSTWITKQQLKEMLAPFLTPVIAETNLLPFFIETRFNDQTINAITFTYDPLVKLPDSIKIRHWDVYVDPDKGLVTKVYIVKLLTENGITITQQLTWQTDKHAKIVNILNKPNGDLKLIKETLLQWSFK